MLVDSNLEIENLNQLQQETHEGVHVEAKEAKKKYAINAIHDILNQNQDQELSELQQILADIPDLLCSDSEVENSMSN